MQKEAMHNLILKRKVLDSKPSFLPLFRGASVVSFRILSFRILRAQVQMVQSVFVKV